MKNKEMVARLVLSTFLGLGFLTAWILVGIVAVENVQMAALQDRVTDSLMIRADGTALIAHHEHGAISHRDLSGAPVEIPEDDRHGWFSGTKLPDSLPWRNEDRDWDQRARNFSDGRSPQTAWYFITDGQPNGTAYFVGYDGQSKAKVGYLGINGYRSEEPRPEERFPFAGATTGDRKRVFFPPGQDGRRHVMVASGSVYSAGEQVTAAAWTVYVLGLDDKLYEINLRQRAVRVLAHERELRSFATLADITDSSHTNWRLALRTDRMVLVLDRDGREHQRYPIPEELRERSFTFGEISAEEALITWSREHDILETDNPHLLFWVGPEGCHRSVAVTLPGRPFRELRYLVAAVVPSPLVLDVLGVLRVRQLLSDGLVPTWSSAVGRTLEEFWPAGVLAQLLSAALAVLCYRRQALYGVSRTERIVWPLFVLLLGLPGWIGYRFGRSWPALESCPECGRTVPRDRASCARCDRVFPAPVLRGTEVFA